MRLPIGTILLLLFIALPLAELALLVWLTLATSIWFTLAVVLVTAMLGATMLRRQGLGVWLAANREIAAGRFPADQLLDGIILLMGGAFLLTPGLITDCLGTLALLPPSRAVIRLSLKRWLAGAIASGTIRVATVGGSPFTQPKADQPEFVEGDRAEQWPGAAPSPFDRR